MRKIVITVLLCLGLFVAVGQQGFFQEARSQEGETVAVPATVQGEFPAFPSQPRMPAGGMLPAGPALGGVPSRGPEGRAPMELDRLDPRIAAGMRGQLIMQLREISLMLGQVDQQDTQFIEMLLKEQASITEQLKSLESPPGTRTVGEVEAAAPTFSPGQPTGDPRSPFRPTPAAPTAPPTLPPNWQQYSPEELAKFLAEQAPAFPTTRQLPQRDFQPNYPAGYQPPPFGGSALTPPAYAGAPAQPPAGGFAVPPSAPMGMPSPWGTSQPSREIVELKEAVSTLQGQIEQMREEIKALNAQIRILNHNIVLQMGDPGTR